jgi:hypothetical protein
MLSTHRTPTNGTPFLARWARRGVLCLAAVLVVVTAAAADRALADVGPTYRLIANPSCPLSEVDRGFVAQAFLKKIRRWPDGEMLQPVDLDSRSAVRRTWSSDVLSRSVEAVRTYWQQMIFSGRELPPPEMRSDEEVIGYVLKRPGGIGYVSTTADLRGAKVLTIR